MIISNFSLGKTDVIFEGTGARFDIFQHPQFEYGPVLNLALPRDNVDSVRVRQVGDIDAGLEAGAYAGFVVPYSNQPEGELNGYLSLRRNVTDDEAGTVLVGLVEYFYAPLFFLRVGVNVSATYADSDHMQTYFGVSEAASARSGLASFEADAGLRDVSVSAYSILSLSRRWGVFGRVLASRLMNDAARSPIVTEEGSREQYFGGLGVFINFY